MTIHEKFEQPVKWTLRALTAVGVLSGALALSPIAGIGLGLALVLLEQFFERAVFEYSTIYALPGPDFSFRSSSWIEMAYAFPGDPEGYQDPELPNMCGLVFDDPEQASGVMRLIDAWATGPDGGGTDNVVVSLVFEDDGGYILYVYPDLERRNLSKVFEETRRLQLEDKLGKRQQGLVVFMKLGKYFKVTENSPLHFFLDRRQNVTDKYLFGCYTKTDKGYVQVEADMWVETDRFLVQSRGEISEHDIEWEDPRSLTCRMQEDE